MMKVKLWLTITCTIQHEVEVKTCHWPVLEKEYHWAFQWTLTHYILSQVSSHFHSCADIRYQSPFTKSLDLPALVRLARQWGGYWLFRLSGYLSAPAEDLGSLERSVWTSPSSCAIPFPLFPTELIRFQLFSCSGVKFLSSPRPPPTAPSGITNTVLCSADCCDILIKSHLKGRSHCHGVNPHRSFTLFKQIRRGLSPFGSAKSDSTKGGL